jgi:Carboxypeptidase regulatory-like domain
LNTKTNWLLRWPARSLWYWSGLVVLFAILAGAAPWGNAQIATTTATLSGVIVDPSGALVPAATISLSSIENGITRELTTTSDGRYAFVQLPPSTYILTVSAKGFETYKQTGIALNPSDTATQNVSLVVGTQSQSITVTADASQLNTDNSNVATSLDAKQIVELPLNVRNVYGLATLNSAVQNTSEGQLLLGGGSNTTDTADQDISFMNFAGGFFGTTAFLVDGSWDTDTEWGAVIFVPGVDSVQEFKVQTNSFTAQYGWSTGNVVNVVTKSGSSNFHGSAYEFYSSNNANALNYFQSPGSCQGLLNTNLCTFSRNQVGGTAGGPLYIPGVYKQRNKTFIFGQYEHFHANTPSPSSYTVPDTNFLAGNFSEQLATTSSATDALGRPIYDGQIYDPRSGHAITAGQDDAPSPSNPYGTGLMATQTGYIRNPVPGNILSNIAGYTPDPVGSKLLSYFPAAKTPGNVPDNLILAGEAPTYWDEYGIRVDHNFNSNTGTPIRKRQRPAPPITGEAIRRVKAISGPTTAGACGRDSRIFSAPPLPRTSLRASRFGMRHLPISRSVSTRQRLSDFRRMSIKWTPCFPLSTSETASPSWAHSAATLRELTTTARLAQWLSTWSNRSERTPSISGSWV